jgi:hypothetical protein
MASLTGSRLPDLIGVFLFAYLPEYLPRYKIFKRTKYSLTTHGPVPYFQAGNLASRE